MKIKVFFIVIITGTIFSCVRSSNTSLLKADWISEDKKAFLFIEDTMMLQTIIESSEYVVKYNTSRNIINIYTQDSEDYRDLNQKNLMWKYKILNVDSNKLTIIRLFPQPCDTFLFSKIANSKRNNLHLSNLELSAGPCFGHCPVINLKITNDSLIYQFGHYFTRHQGLHKYKLSPLEYKRLQNLLQAIPVDSLIFSQPGPDRQFYDLYASSGSSILNISGNLDWNSCYDIKAFIFYLINLDKMKDLRPSTDSVIFKSRNNYEN